MKYQITEHIVTHVKRPAPHGAGGLKSEDTAKDIDNKLVPPRTGRVD